MVFIIYYIGYYNPSVYSFLHELNDNTHAEGEVSVRILKANMGSRRVILLIINLGAFWEW